jgi:hypothetical protein
LWPVNGSVLRRTVKLMLIRQAKATMNHTMAQPSDKVRPR